MWEEKPVKGRGEDVIMIVVLQVTINMLNHFKINHVFNWF